ncbi:MAG: DUF1189 family protein [Gammaproteobacteria bacterium]|nr:DUF1189 family protein [Gammaproteobacteria bacterium]
MTKKKNKAQLPVGLDKPLYHYWQALYMSFYSKELYIDVIRRWHGLGWLYLLLVVALFSIPLSINLGLGAQHFFTTQVVEDVKSMPQFMIQNGVVVFDKPMPFEIKNVQHDVIGMIDTTGKTEALDNDRYPKLTYLITKNKIFYRTPSFHTLNNDEEGAPAGPIFSQTIDSKTNEVFSGADFVRDVPIERIRMIIMASTYPIVVVLLFSMLAGFFLLLGVTGRFVAKLMLRSPLTFMQSCRLVAISATPALLFLFVFLTLHRNFSFSGTVFLAMIAFNYCLAAIVYRRDSQQVARR